MIAVERVLYMKISCLQKIVSHKYSMENGFTLIELMITVAIVAILASVAIPSYNQYIKRGYATEGLTALDATAGRMEQRFQDIGSYASGTSCAVPDQVTGKFNITCQLTPTGYLLKAVGAGVMAGYSYSIDQDGVKKTIATPYGTPSSNCWSIRGTSCDAA